MSQRPGPPLPGPFHHNLSEALDLPGANVEEMLVESCDPEWSGRAADEFFEQWIARGCCASRAMNESVRHVISGRQLRRGSPRWLGRSDRFYDQSTITKSRLGQWW